MQASFLRASLFTSVVAYGVALFAAGMGVLSILFGWAIHRLAARPGRREAVGPRRRVTRQPARRAHMDPHDALTEIATLLERERSSRYKSKAFRTAADAIEGLSDEQLRDAATLRRRKGIGDSTFAVIQEALDGRVPGYLADLRERAGRAAVVRRCADCCAATCTATANGRTD